MTTITNVATEHVAVVGPRNVGLHGWTMVTWAVAGGIALGGFLTALMTLEGQLSANGLFLTSTGLFIIGAVLGWVHGGVLGLFGRAKGFTAREALRDLMFGSLYALPALAVGWLATVWIALTVVALYMGQLATTVGVVLGWLVGAMIVATAAVLGFRSLGNAYARWPERAPGTVLVAGSFAALLIIFLADRPELWGLRLRVNEVGGVLLAAAVSLWLVGPLVTLALRLVKELPDRVRPQLWPNTGWGAAADGTLGLTVGVVAGLLAVPFVVPSVAPASVGAVLVEVSGALVDEVLLRLILVTGVAWLLLRWHKLHREEVAVVTVIAVALVQAAIYTPGILAIGFPSVIAATAFAFTAVVIPGLVFGLLYWTRGFSTALLADAAFVALVLILST